MARRWLQEGGVSPSLQELPRTRQIHTLNVMGLIQSVLGHYYKLGIGRERLLKYIWRLLEELIIVRVGDFWIYNLNVLLLRLLIVSRLHLRVLLLVLLFSDLSISHPVLAHPHYVLLLLHQQAIQILLYVHVQPADLPLCNLAGVFGSEHVAEPIVDSPEVLQLHALLVLHPLVLEDLLALSDDPLAHLHDLLHVLVLEVDDLLEGVLVHLDHLSIVIFGVGAQVGGRVGWLLGWVLRIA